MEEAQKEDGSSTGLRKQLKKRYERVKNLLGSSGGYTP
jgi:hypothetical protein